MKFLRLFLKHYFVVKLLVPPGNVSCFLRLRQIPQTDGPSSNPSKQKNITGQTVYSPKIKTVQYSHTDSSSATNYCSIENPSTPI